MKLLTTKNVLIALAVIAIVYFLFFKEDDKKETNKSQEEGKEGETSNFEGLFGKRKFGLGFEKYDYSTNFRDNALQKYPTRNDLTMGLTSGLYVSDESNFKKSRNGFKLSAGDAVVLGRQKMCYKCSGNAINGCPPVELTPVPCNQVANMAKPRETGLFF
jgi:hypothetical protein